MVSIDFSISENNAFVVRNELIPVCSFAKNECCCSDVITAISSARQVAIRAKFARFNSVRANGKTAEIREEAADIINFLSSTCKLSSCEIKCVFKHFGGF